MRRTDREIKEMEQIYSILERGIYCTLALFEGVYPYAVPLNYGVDQREGTVFLYFHCAKEGKKLNLIRNDPHAAFTVVCEAQVPPQETPCAYTCFYESVCGSGTIRVVEGEEARRGLFHIVDKVDPVKAKLLPAGAEEQVCVLELTVEKLTGKAHR